MSECKWKEDNDGCWWTDCGQGFVLADGTPKENDMKFCCYCGKPLEEKLFKWPEDEEQEGEGE